MPILSKISWFPFPIRTVSEKQKPHLGRWGLNNLRLLRLEIYHSSILMLTLNITTLPGRLTFGFE